MVEARLGNRQRTLLAQLGSPSLFLVDANAAAKSLAKLGLVKAHDPDGDSFFAITPAGLRALADEMIAGRLKQELPRKESPNV